MVSTRAQTLKNAKKRLLEDHCDSSDRPCKSARRTEISPPRTPISGDPIDHWVRTSKWPKQVNEMQRVLARRKSTASARSQSRKRSEPGDTDAADAPVPYADPKFNKLLEKHDSYLFKSTSGLTKQSKELCKGLLERPQTLPSDKFFGDKFEQICNQVQNRNEARIVHSITPHIVPSAEEYDLDYNGQVYLIETRNESWSNAWLLSRIEKRPQPDYAVGFQQAAFTPEQQGKLKPWIGDPLACDQSHFMATYMMLFPFLTCEVKSSAASLDAADHQNGLSMTIAVRGVVQLFRAVGREAELHREILGFSVSHDACSVRLYGHFAEIDGQSTRCYRETIRNFYFTEQEGKERGTSYRIITNIYATWVPMHLDRIRSAVDQLPERYNSFEETQTREDSERSTQVDCASDLSQRSSQTTVTPREPSKKARVRGPEA